VNYVSGSGTSTLAFSYTVAAGHQTSDLDYTNQTALSANGGTILDIAGNSATLTLPAVGSGTSIGGQKAIVIDQTPPVITYTSVSPASPATSATPTITMSLSKASSVTLYSNNTCTAAISDATSLAGTSGQTITTNALTSDVAIAIHAKAVDSVNNASSCTSLLSYTYDSIAPSIGSFARKSGQPSVTNSVPMNFEITFSEAINPASFTAADISNAGTATGVAWTITNSGNNTTFTVAATVAGNGTVQPRFAAGAVTDVAGNSRTVAGTGFIVDKTVSAANLTIDSAATAGATAIEMAAGAVYVTAEAGARASVTFVNAADSLRSVVKLVTVTGTATKVTLSADEVSSLGQGTINVSATLADAAGNSALEANNQVAVTLDTTAPSPPGTPTFNTTTGVIESSVLSDVASAKLFAGTREVTSLFDVRVASGKTTFTPRSAQVEYNTATNFTVRGLDLAGNESGDSNTLAYRFDNKPPAAAPSA
jgi:hypothetical protein